MTEQPEMKLSIGDLAEATGRSVDTLRYWDREGLIPRVARNGAGHRRFAEDHIRWVALLGRLSASGMSIERVRRYAELADRGDATIDERRELLELHAREMREHITELQHCLKIVEAKIDLYAGRLQDRSVIWELVEEGAEIRLSPTARGIRSEPGG